MIVDVRYSAAWIKMKNLKAKKNIKRAFSCCTTISTIKESNKFVIDAEFVVMYAMNFLLYSISHTCYVSDPI